MNQSDVLPKSSFWADKIPCWVVRGCIAEARQLCAAYQDQSLPCWEHEDTLCKELFDVDTCSTCKVFKRYGPSNNERA